MVSAHAYPTFELSNTVLLFSKNCSQRAKGCGRVRKSPLLPYFSLQVLRPMVKIARQVIARNGYSEVIRIVPKRSTEMTSGDMLTRANILVTEVFDTELIGEGALVTFAHAHKELLEVNQFLCRLD